MGPARRDTSGAWCRVQGARGPARRVIRRLKPTAMSNIQSRQYPISKEVTRSPPCLPLGIGYLWEWILDIELASASGRHHGARATPAPPPAPPARTPAPAATAGIPRAGACRPRGRRQARPARCVREDAEHALLGRDVSASVKRAVSRAPPRPPAGDFRPAAPVVTAHVTPE